MTLLARVAVLSLFVATLVGCGATPASAPAAGTAVMPSVGDAVAPKSAVFANQLGGVNPNRIRIVQLDIYQLVIPLGAISRSEEFWKHVDEDDVDVGTYDLLRKNGWRLGVAPKAEWSYFRDIIDSYPAYSKPSSINASGAGGAGSLELTMKKEVDYQNIFYFTDANALIGRTYEKCENLLNISLDQAPRRVGEARVTVCPTVRSLRKRFEVTGTGDERIINYVHPERLYDLNLQADIPVGHFLIVAPSPEVRWKTSLGATFLVQDAATEQKENVLLMVPRASEFEEVAPAAQKPAAAKK